MPGGDVGDDALHAESMQQRKRDAKAYVDRRSLFYIGRYMEAS